MNRVAAEGLKAGMSVEVFLKVFKVTGKMREGEGPGCCSASALLETKLPTAVCLDAVGVILFVRTNCFLRRMRSFSDINGNIVAVDGPTAAVVVGGTVTV